jgi:hypothetical protein
VLLSIVSFLSWVTGVIVNAEVGVASVLFSIVKLVSWAIGVRVNAELGVVSLIDISTVL